MLPYKRSERVADLLRQEISNIILRRMKDPRIEFVTVTDVGLTKDLKFARVFVSVLDKDVTQRTLQILNGASHFIRHEVAKKVRMKFIPQIEFFEDKSLDYGEKIDRLLEQVKEES